MKVHKRIIFVLIGLIIAFLIGLISTHFWAVKRAQMIQSGRVELLLGLFKSVISLKGQSLSTLTYDYAIWDEMASFAKQGDLQWAKKNIESALIAHKADIAWIFHLDHSLTYFYEKDRDESWKQFIQPSMLPTIFNDQQVVQFFFRTPKGFLEIRGSTIHPSMDFKRESPMQGYFLVGRLWDRDYISEIARAIGGIVTTVEETYTDDEPGELTDYQGNLYFTLHFKNWDGTPLRNLKFIINAPLIKDFSRGSVGGFLIGSILSFCFILFISWVIIVWVSFPLKKISLYLKNNNICEINSLLPQKNEFGHISRLLYKHDQLEKRLKYCADHDALTGIYNRGAILSFLEKEISRAKRYGSTFSIVIADLDYFKKINDTYGHVAGDKVLQEVASCLSVDLRKCDWVGRYGGEEFLLLLPDSHTNDAFRLAQRIKDKVEKQGIVLSEKTIHVTISMGIAQYIEQEDTSSHDTIRRADSALYRAKDHGRNCIMISESNMDEPNKYRILGE